MIMVKLSHIIFYIKDMSATLKFYESSFGIKPRFVDESNSYAELETGSITLAFASEELASSNLPRGFQKLNAALPQACEIAFTTDDVNALYDKAIKEGATAIAPAKLKPWGQTVAYVQDPMGILIEIASEMN
jgi:uncharacterized glyoxalase superfamily protein PhnB